MLGDGLVRLSLKGIHEGYAVDGVKLPGEREVEFLVRHREHGGFYPVRRQGHFLRLHFLQHIEAG